MGCAAVLVFICGIVWSQALTTTNAYLPNDPRANVQIQTYCIGNTGITQEKVTILEPNQSLTEEINCYFQCVFQQSGYLDQNGELILSQFQSAPFTSQIDYQCLQNLGPINQCNDMNRIYECNI